MQGSLIVKNARIFDGHGPELFDGDIRIEAGRIVDIEPRQPAGDVRQVDAAGRVVIPGLIDNHFHAYLISLNALHAEAAPASYLTLAGARRLSEALARGFTTVRDVGGGDIGLARAISEGLITAPRYYFAGRALSQTGGHGDFRDPHLELECGSCHVAQVVDGVDALRGAVRELFRRGAHAIKIMASGGVASPADPLTVPQYSAQEIAVVVEEATRRGSYVAAHAYSSEAIIHAVSNGVRTIEHGNLLDQGAAAVMAERGAALVPTLVTYWAMAEQGEALGLPAVSLAKNKQVLDAGMASIEIASAAGIPVGFGSDLMGDLQSQQLRGLQLHHEVQGTLELLRSLTSRGAEILGVDDLGWIRPGSLGDLVLLAHDPFERPATLWTGPSEDRIVVRGGVVVA